MKFGLMLYSNFILRIDASADFPEPVQRLICLNCGEFAFFGCLSFALAPIRLLPNIGTVLEYRGVEGK